MQTGTMEVTMPRVAAGQADTANQPSALEQFSEAVLNHANGVVNSLLAVGVDGAIVAAGLSRKNGISNVQIASLMGGATQCSTRSVSRPARPPRSSI